MGTQIQNRPTLLNNFASSADVFSKLIPLFVGSGKTTSTVNSNTQSLGTDVISKLTESVLSGQYSKDAAMKDSAAAIDLNSQRILEKFLPGIATAQKTSGLYKDSASRLQTNDLVARIAGEAAKAQQESIINYANINNQTVQNLKGAQTSGTSTQVSQTAPATDPLMTLLGIGASSLLPSILGGLTTSIFGGEDKPKKAPNDFGGDIFSFNNAQAANIAPPSVSTIDISPALTQLTSAIADNITPAFSSMDFNLEGGDTGGTINFDLGKLLGSIFG